MAGARVVGNHLPPPPRFATTPARRRRRLVKASSRPSVARAHLARKAASAAKRHRAASLSRAMPSQIATYSRGPAAHVVPGHAQGSVRVQRAAGPPPCSANTWPAIAGTDRSVAGAAGEAAAGSVRQATGGVRVAARAAALLGTVPRARVGAGSRARARPRSVARARARTGARCRAGARSAAIHARSRDARLPDRRAVDARARRAAGHVHVAGLAGAAQIAAAAARPAFGASAGTGSTADTAAPPAAAGATVPQVAGRTRATARDHAEPERKTPIESHGHPPVCRSRMERVPERWAMQASNDWPGALEWACVRKGAGGPLPAEMASLAAFASVRRRHHRAV